MAKTIDLTENVAALCGEYPELVEILVSLGFTPLANPVMRKLAGSHMTIPGAAESKGVPMETILGKLQENGFEIAK
ncbi:MAG TPA: hypothetical protein DGX96_04135 [Lachnospiraceae bacterium]|jgi:hypothetical protein|nr:hypothetical protein [Lachnospiraceae bacterium]